MYMLNSNIELDVIWGELPLLFLQLGGLGLRAFLRYYDFKRTAEKKEQKTMEAVGKVRGL